MSDGLDDEYGPIPADDALDPTHLRSMAKRISVLAGLLEAVQKSGERRDGTLGRIESQIKTIRQEVDSLLRATSQFTPEQRKTLEDIILGRDRSRWLWERIKLLAFYAMTVISSVWAIREFFPAAWHFLKATLP